MLQIPSATSYIGCIGKDKFGVEMKKNSKAAGVNVSSIIFSIVHLHCFILSLGSYLQEYSVFLNIINMRNYCFCVSYKCNIMRMKQNQLVHAPFLWLGVKGED